MHLDIMNRFLLVSLLILFTNALMAQQSNPAYQAQRKKVNGLLQDRKEKFGQYSQSLSMRSGIFGLKTKKDMQRSIDILTEIVETDDTIL